MQVLWPQWTDLVRLEMNRYGEAWGTRLFFAEGDKAVRSRCWAVMQQASSSDFPHEGGVFTPQDYQLLKGVVQRTKEEPAFREQLVQGFRGDQWMVRRLELLVEGMRLMMESPPDREAFFQEGNELFMRNGALIKNPLQGNELAEALKDLKDGGERQALHLRILGSEAFDQWEKDAQALIEKRGGRRWYESEATLVHRVGTIPEVLETLTVHLARTEAARSFIQWIWPYRRTAADIPYYIDLYHQGSQQEFASFEEMLGIADRMFRQELGWSPRRDINRGAIVIVEREVKGVSIHGYGAPVFLPFSFRGKRWGNFRTLIHELTHAYQYIRAEASNPGDFYLALFGPAEDIREHLPLLTERYIVTPEFHARYLPERLKSGFAGEIRERADFADLYAQRGLVTYALFDLIVNTGDLSYLWKFVPADDPLASRSDLSWRQIWHLLEKHLLWLDGEPEVALDYRARGHLVSSSGYFPKYLSRYGFLDKVVTHQVPLFEALEKAATAGSRYSEAELTRRILERLPIDEPA